MTESLFLTKVEVIILKNPEMLLSKLSGISRGRRSRTLFDGFGDRC